MKVLILCDHYPISPRVKKIRNSIIKLYPNTNVKVFAWNRNNKTVTEDYVYTFNQDIGYGKKLRKLLNMGKFLKSSRQFSNDFKPDYIHAIDFEMLINSKLISKEARIIYEVYDIKFFNNKIFNWMREKIELLIIERDIHAMVLASPYFKTYYKEKGIEDIKTAIINNKPSKELNTEINSNYMDDYRDLLKDKIVVGFIGTVRYQNILMNLIDACNKLNNVVILLAGDGPSYNYIKNYIKSNDFESKVIMTGRYNAGDLKSIYKLCDYVWAAYPNKDLNVRYAISNKFFESIVFRKKIIVSKDTMLGDYVNKINVGYTINPYDIEEISGLLNVLNKDYILEKNLKFEDGVYWEDEEERLYFIFDK